jgi:hypothetical protein
MKLSIRGQTSRSAGEAKTNEPGQRHGSEVQHSNGFRENAT